MNTSTQDASPMLKSRWWVISGVFLAASLIAVAWIATTQRTQIATTTQPIQASRPNFTMIYRQEYVASDSSKTVQRYRYSQLNTTDWEFEIKELPAVAESNAALGPSVGSIYRYERKGKQVTIYQRDGATGKEDVSMLEAGVGNEILSYWLDPSYIDRLKARTNAILDRLPTSTALAVSWDDADVGTVSVDNTAMCNVEKTCTTAREEIAYSRKYQIPLSIVAYRDNVVAGGIYVESLDVAN